MDKETVRLECLKLACGKSANQQEILAKAAEYEKFVNGETVAGKPAAPSIPPKP